MNDELCNVQLVCADTNLLVRNTPIQTEFNFQQQSLELRALGVLWVLCVLCVLCVLYALFYVFIGCIMCSVYDVHCV